MIIIIRTKVAIVWSWKYRSCSMVGELASWNVINLHVGIYLSLDR